MVLIDLHYGADQERHVHGIDRGADLSPRILIPERVDVRGVLRPEDDIRPGLAGRDLGGQAHCALHVVVEHGPTFGVEVQAGPRHIALDISHGDRTPLRRQRDDGGDRQQDGTDRHRPGRCPPLPFTQAVGRVQQSSADGNDSEGHPRGAGPRGIGHQRAIGLTEGNPRPREAPEGRGRASPLPQHPHHRQRGHSGKPVAPGQEAPAHTAQDAPTAAR